MRLFACVVRSGRLYVRCGSAWIEGGFFFHVLFMLLALEAGLEAVYVSPMG